MRYFIFMVKKIDSAQTSSVRRADAKAPVDKTNAAQGPDGAKAAYLLKAKEDLQFLRNLPFGAK